jgi:hypothetical protein
MFLNYPNLAEDPIGVAPDPRFLFLVRQHREAMASLAYRTQSNRGFVATQDRFFGRGQRLDLATTNQNCEAPGVKDKKKLNNERDCFTESLASELSTPNQ